MTRDILSELNPEQREAVETIQGPLLVLAGAGTGKTRVITYRIAWMLRKGIAPENILGMTFTNKAAKEMEERVAAMVTEEQAKKVTLGTFHSFCARLLRKEIKCLGYTPRFTIADSSDQAGIVRQAAAELGYSKEELASDAVLSFIGRAKNNMKTARQTVKDPMLNPFEIKAARVYEKYQEILELQNMLDFDDLLLLAHRIWDENPDVLEKYREIYKYILVDEYQDTNQVQFKLIRMLTGDSMNLCVVGDDDQSIYGWRGAIIDNILNFPEHFPGTKIIKLERNYRSTDKILSSANTIISGNRDRYAKILRSTRGEGEDIILVKHESAEAEAAFVAKAVDELMHRDRDLQYSDIAVLFRSNHLSRLLEQEFRKNEIPYRLVGGQEFFNRKEIRDAAAYLKIVVNSRDDQSLLRILNVPPRGIGAKPVELLKKYHAASFVPFLELLENGDFLAEIPKAGAFSIKDFSSCVKKYRELFSQPGDLYTKARNFLDEIGYLDGLQKIYKNYDESLKRLENVNEFLNAIAAFEQKYNGTPYLFEFMESFALLDENDKTREDKESGNAVTFTTVHAAKGLEFPCVFIIGLEHNVFPHERSVEEQRLDEERRLFYVALTRAKDKLVLSSSMSRMRYGKKSRQMPSNFLEELKTGNSDDIDNIDPEEYFTPADNEELKKGFAEIFSILKEDQ